MSETADKNNNLKAMTEKSNLSTTLQRKAPRLEVLVQGKSEDIPELTICPFAALRHRVERNMRSIGVAPWSEASSPMRQALWMKLFYFDSNAFLILFSRQKKECLPGEGDRKYKEDELWRN